MYRPHERFSNLRRHMTMKSTQELAQWAFGQLVFRLIAIDTGSETEFVYQMQEQMKDAAGMLTWEDIGEECETESGANYELLKHLQEVL